MNFFVLGDDDVVLGFRFAGINGKAVYSKEDIEKEFNNVIKGDYGDIGVLILTEKTVKEIEDKVNEWQQKALYPLLVEIPDLYGHIEGRVSMLDSIKKAIGISI